MKKSSERPTFESDILILGGGCSGWSLVAALIDSNLHNTYRISIVEKSQDDVNKTWSHWDDLTESKTWNVDTKWNSLRLNIDTDFSTKLEEAGIYKSIKASNFNNSIREKATQLPSIQLFVDEIENCNFKDKIAFGRLNAYKSEIIFHNFDFNKMRIKEKNDALTYPLLQHFKGLLIESEKPAFDANEAIFMDFNVSQEYGFAFMYILPYSDKKALFEYTLFSEKRIDEELYENEIYSYLASNFKLQKEVVKVLEEEMGVIPMNDAVPTITDNTNWYKLGTIAGMTKASTGYTFARIQQSCRAVATTIKQFGLNNPNEIEKALEQGISTFRYRAYDIILLDLLKNDPNAVIQAFKVLFSKLGVRRMLRFLSEDQSFLADLAVLNTVNKWTFTKAFWRAKKVIFKHLFK